MAEDVRHVTETEYRQLETDARRKDWPLRLKTIVAWNLLVTAWLVYVMSDRAWWLDARFAEEAAKVTQTVQEALRASQVETQVRFAQTVQETIAPLLAEITRKHREADALLGRVQTLQWVVATPELERDRQLKEAVEALTGRRE
mgnify:CR=1 FL=1